MGCRGWAPLCSTASVLWFTWAGMCVCSVCVCIYIVVLLTCEAACRLCPASQLHWLPWALPAGTAASNTASPAAPVLLQHLVGASAGGVSACFTRLPRHNDRVPVDDTQRRLPTWTKKMLLGWCMFPSGSDGLLLDDAQRGSRCLCFSSLSGKPPSRQEIHDPVFAP